MAEKSTNQNQKISVTLDGMQKIGGSPLPLLNPKKFIEGFFSNKTHTNICEDILGSADLEVIDTINTETQVIFYCQSLDEETTVTNFQEENSTLDRTFTRKLKKSLSKYLNIDEDVFAIKVGVAAWEENSKGNPVSTHDFSISMEGKLKEGDSIKPMDNPKLFVEGFSSDNIHACKTLLGKIKIEVIDIMKAETQIILYCNFLEEDVDLDDFIAENPKLSQKITKKLKVLSNSLKLDAAHFYVEVVIHTKQLEENQREDCEHSGYSKNPMDNKTTTKSAVYEENTEKNDYRQKYTDMGDLTKMTKQTPLKMKTGEIEIDKSTRLELKTYNRQNAKNEPTQVTTGFQEYSSSDPPSQGAVICQSPHEPKDVSTQFHLFMPEAFGEVVELWIESDSSALHGFKLEPSKVAQNVWTSEVVTIPFSLTYKYAGKFKSGSFLNFRWSNEKIVKEDNKRVLKENCLQLDIFQHSPGKKSFTMPMDAKSYFFRVLLSRVDQSNLKCKLAEGPLQYFMETSENEKCKHDMCEIISSQISLSEDLTPTQLLYCTILLSQVKSQERKLVLKEADELLRGIDSYVHGSLSDSDRHLLSRMMHPILCAKYGTSWDMNHVIYHFAPAVGYNAIHELCKFFGKSALSPEFGKKAANKVCLEKYDAGASNLLALSLMSLNKVEELIEVVQFMQQAGVDRNMAKIGKAQVELHIENTLKRNCTFTELTDLWKFVVEMNDIPWHTQADILRKIKRYIKEMPENADADETMETVSVRKVLTPSIFKHDHGLGVILLKAFAKCKSCSLFLLGIDMLDCCQNWKEEEVVEFAKDWMETAIGVHSNQYRKRPNERIPIIYNFLDKLVNSDSANKFPVALNLSEKKAEEFVKRLTIKAAFGIFNRHQESTSTGMHIFQEHLLEKIKNDNKLDDPRSIGECILSLMNKEEDALTNESRAVQVVLEALLDKLAKGNGMKACKDVIKYARMLMAVVKASGKFAKDVMNHRVMQNVQDLLQLLGREVESLTIDQGEFKIIYDSMKKREVRFELFEYFNPRPRGTDANHWPNLFEKAALVLKELETKGRSLEKLFHFFLPNIALSREIQMHDHEECLDLLSKKTGLTTAKSLGSMEYVSSDKFWGKLHDFVKIAEALYEYHSVQSFVIYSKTEIKPGSLQRHFGYSCHPEDADGSHLDKEKDDYSCLEVSTFLEEHCLIGFQNVLKEMFMCDNDIKIFRIKSFIPNDDVFQKDMKVLEKLDFKMHHRKKDAWSNYVEYPSYKVKVRALLAAASHIGITLTKGNKIWTPLKRFAEQEEADMLMSTLYTLHNDIDKVRTMLNELDVGDTWAIVTELSRAQTLLSFLLEIPDENLLHLTDATEEHSEQHIQVSLVSDLILLHKAFYHLLQSDRKNMSLKNFIKMIIDISNSKTFGEERDRKIAARINDCVASVHGLKALYQNVANREELTKGIVENALNIGMMEYEIDISLKECVFILKYEKNDTKYSHSMQDLFDLRSRALLVANSEKKDPETEGLYDTVKRKQAMQLFVDNIERAFHIAESCTRLHQSGHFKFQKYQHMIAAGDTETLQSALSDLQTQLDTWNVILADARKQYYPLNFVWGDQLMLLKDAIDSGDMKELVKAKSILRYIHSGILKSPKLYEILGPSEGHDMKAQLCDLGQKLLCITENLEPHLRYMQHPPCIENHKMKVKPGELYIAALDPGSKEVIPVIMMLYGDTVKCFPEPCQILFCHEDTSWEEIHLLLQRCFHANRQTGLRELFCVANLEVLPGEVQTRLVDEVEYLLKKAENHCQTNFYLCFVIRSSQNGPVVDHFRKCTHRVNGLSQVELEKLLHTYWQDTYVITSEVPGLGKSELVKENAARLDMGTATISISGPFCRHNLVKNFADLKIGIRKDLQVLHIDIGMTPSPYSLDSFLFELIVVGAASSGTNITWLETDKIAIEVANSIQDKLRNSLTFVHAFNRICLKWENYRNFRVSDESNSSTQVVCHYLEAMESGDIDERNIYFVGDMSSQPIPEERCQTLLARCFDQGQDMSFTVALVFLDVLADQLKKMSASYFCRVENISAMVDSRDCQRIRYTLVSALINISKEFACRSVQSCRSSQAMAEKNECVAMVNRVQGMIQWADSNHLMIAFQSQGTQTVSVLYRKKDEVPRDIQILFKSQLQKDLKDFDKLEQDDLQSKVERFMQVDVGQKPALDQGFLKMYALTPDNFLKMVLISLRIKAGVPVVLMGETGCGKTSLIKYLAAVGNIKLDLFNFHAGVTEKQIKERLLLADQEAKKTTNQYWIFLDEVNTCHHLGVLSEIICHRTCQGKSLSQNLIMIAACNPYRLREKNQIMTSGLKSKISTDPLSRLVYRVYPLPEAMTDYVWDYGTLNEKDEKAYIERMMTNVFGSYHRKNMLVPVLVESQRFLRKIEETAWSVSLRDVNRCRHLMKWFYDMLSTKAEFPLKDETDQRRVITQGRYGSLKTKLDTRRCDDSVILALAHCYFSRIHRSEDRMAYLENLATILYPYQNRKDTAKALYRVIKREQMDLLDRMEIGEGIARNTALRENVFVIFVSIFNRIPVFVIGKPGCSKSLSMQLLRSSLRGPDSKDEYFKTLPQLYVVSHQGSESSTSEGIEKVFKKAEQYLEHNRGPNVLPVVLLDEIGLAEVSRFNPLKVLHSLLEPTTGEVPNVAVVGISNWALDAAKMNRAIHLSRPDLDEEELYQTAISIGEEYQTVSQGDIFEKLYKAMAAAYFEYQRKQKEKNFHGLRDYYALIKYISKQEKPLIESNVNEIILKGLCRNFGGMQMEVILQIFNSKLEGVCNGEFIGNHISAKKLVKENLSDQKARYLMLITDGDTSTGIVENILQEQSREYKIIIGSNFEEDQTEDYCYRILSQIILCMERGVILILKDLDPIYGSLYDMLNQNYTKSGNKLHCRVAIGPYSNPICLVHEHFRCIVLMDRKDINKVDPPFLNRFEKQQLQFSHIMTPEQKQIVKLLTIWVDAFATLTGHYFTKKQCFLGFHEDLIPTLVLRPELDTIDECNQRKEPVEDCKQKLLMLASPDAVKRLKRTLLATTEYDVQLLANEYFQRKIHRSLRDCVTNIDMEYPCVDNKVDRIVIYTHSSIHVDLKQYLGVEFPSVIERLSSFSSEKQMASRIKTFWFESDAKYFLLQCKPSLDAEHILSAKYQMENCRSQYKQKEGEKKIVIFLMHLGRNDDDAKDMSQFSFLDGWSLVSVDTLEEMEHPLSEFHDKSVMDILESPILPLCTVVEENLLWAFTCIKYQGSEYKRNALAITALIKQIKLSEGLMNGILKALRRIIEVKIDHEDSHDWQVNVACDVNMLGNASSFRMALCHYIDNIVKNHLAKLVYRWEILGIWDCLAEQTNENDDILSLPEYWIPLDHLSDVGQIPDPTGSECYQIKIESHALKFPCLVYFENQLEQVKQQSMKHMKELQENEEHLDQSGFLNWECLHSQIPFYSVRFVDSNRLLLHHPYLKDHIDVYIEEMIKVAFPSLLDGGFSQLVQLVLEEKAGLFRVHDPIEKFVLSHLALWHLDPLISKLFHLAKSCIETIPSGSMKLKNLVHEKLEHFEKLRILEKKKSSTPVLEIQDQTTHSSTNHGEGEVAESPSSEEGFADKTESQNRFDIDETSETVSMPSELATGTQEDAQSKENVVFLPNIPNEDDNLHGSAQIQENESSAGSLVHLQEEKISNIDEDRNTIEMADIISCDSQIRAECLLVDYLCKEMYPTTESIEHNRDIKIWHGRALALLALGRSLGCHYLCSQNFLSLCCDLTGMILIPYSISQNRLVKLGDMGTGEKDGIMANPNLLEFIFQLTRELVKSKVPVDICQQFMCITLSRFVQFDSMSCMIPTFLSKAVIGKLPDPNLNFFGPVLHTLLWCLGDDSSIFDMVCNILAGAGDTSTESWGPLKYIDEELKKNPNNQVSRSFLILMTDMIEDLALQNLPEDFFHEAIQGKTTWDLLEKACEITILSEEITLQRIIAVAFIKKAFFVLANEASEDEPGKLKEVNMALSVTSDENVSATRKTILVAYFLNSLNENTSYGKLRDKAEQLSSHMSVLLDIEWSMKETILSLGYNPLATNPNFLTIVQAWTTFCNKRKDLDFQAFIQKCRTSPSHFLGFLGFVMNFYTLIRPVRPIKDTEKQQMNYIMENTSRFCFSWRLAIEKLLGKSDFNCQMLQLSDQSTLTQQQQASVLYHLMAVVIAYNPIDKDRKLSKNAPIIAKCMLTPQNVLRKSLPALGESELNTYPLFMLDASKEPTVYTCKCGFINLTREEELSCERCQKDSIQVKPSLLQENERFFAQNKMGSQPLKCYSYVRTMTPLSYRVLRLLMQGSLLLAHALDFWPKGQEPSHQDMSMEALLQHYETDWKILCEILNETSDGVCRYIHMIINKLSKFIAEDQNPCSSQEMKQTYEKKFSLLIQEQEKSRVQMTNDWYVRTCLDTGYEQDGIESILGEIPKKRDLDIIPCLFRKKGTKTYESLRLQFMLKKKQMETPFLGYVLQFRKHLELLVHLAPLLKWHREIIHHLNKQLSKIDANEFTIEMFLHKSDETRETLFTKFSKAWNTIKKRENLIALGLEDKLTFMLPTMQKNCLLKTCLISDVDSPLMIMIKALMKVQNTTILQALRIALRAADSSAAIGFYRRTNERTAAPCVYLQDASEKEVMDFKWKEKHLAFSQFNTGLGMGSEVIYDFKGIERAVANSFLHGISFLMLDENFPFFTFSGQLFHSNSSILQDLSTKIPQRNISQQIKSDLEQKSEEPDFAKRLLNVLEIIIPYVNRQDDNIHRSLIQYIETYFGGTFTATSKELLPGHSDELQLSHIVDLYENTEALLVKTAVESLDEKYRKDLPEDSQILKELPDLESVSLEGVIAAVGRVIRRYISSYQDLVNGDEKLLPFMEKPGIWPQIEGSQSTVTKIMAWFEDLQVCHIHHIFALAQESKEEKRPKEPLKPLKKTSRMGEKLPGYSLRTLVD